MASKAEYITKNITRQKTTYTTNAEGKRVKKKEYYKDSVKYRVDAGFNPTSINEICIEYIINYCEANNQGKWLKDEVNTVITDVNGEKRYLPFVNIRADFVNKFMPTILAGNETPVSFRDIINQRFKD